MDGSAGKVFRADCVRSSLLVGGEGVVVISVACGDAFLCMDS